MLMIRPLLLTAILSLFMMAGTGLSGSVWAAHGFAQYGDLQYPPGFKHFSYVNPNAPKGGTLNLPNPDRRTSFDKFNPFSLKGVTAPGIAQLMFESLLIGSADEIASSYGLLAEDVSLAKDQLSVTFRLRANARFNDQSPVLAKDVKYSFDTLMSKLASPQFKTVYADVKQAVVVSERVIRFDFHRKNTELPLLVGSMPIFSEKWGKDATGAGKPFNQLTFEKPIGSGPYLIESYDIGKSIIFKKDSQYWGSDLNVRVGFFNFDRVSYRLYKDDTARLEALKAGEFDTLVEYRAKNWAKSYVGPKFRDGTLKKQHFSHRNGAGMQGFVMNIRKPIFQDQRVREALTLALDFEWMNRLLFYGQYHRIDSYFSNSDLGASYQPGSLPSVAERKLLEPLQRAYPKHFPAKALGPMTLPVTTEAPSSLRQNLRQARELLAQAGWVYKDGALRNAKGQPFEFEFMDDGGAMSRLVLAYARNLEKLGIKVDIRTTDYALYQKRLEEFDFFMTSMKFPDSQSPGNELWDRYGSESASTKGADNIIGVQSPVVDALIGEIVKAQTRKDLITATRALDRVLTHSYYVVPHWYSPTHRVAYKSDLAFPQPPNYFAAESWILSTWWRVPASTNKAGVSQ
ncbi:MAG: extracellular solute-binding protein [Polynucleobacter sp.]